MQSATLLAIMLALVPPANHKHNGESEESARARYEVIAEAVAEESKGNARLALFLLVVARYESTFARKVHTGKVRGDKGRSWGLFQIMCGPRPDGVVPGTEYRAREIVGVDELATSKATHAAAVHLRKHLARCKGSARCVFMNYGGVSQTGDPRIAARVGTFARLASKHLPKPKKK